MDFDSFIRGDGDPRPGPLGRGPRGPLERRGFDQTSLRQHLEAQLRKELGIEPPCDDDGQEDDDASCKDTLRQIDRFFSCCKPHLLAGVIGLATLHFVEQFPRVACLAKHFPELPTKAYEFIHDLRDWTSALTEKLEGQGSDGDREPGAGTGP